MKKLFWGAMYLLAAALIALTVYLYVVPEGEILISEQKETAAEEPVWTDMPVLTLNGVPVEIGVTKFQALLDSGLTVKFEAEGQLYDLDTAKASADPNMQYSVFLYQGEDRVAAVKYTNTGSAACLPGECSVDMMDIDTASCVPGAVPVEFDGIDMNSLKMTEVPEKFASFRMESENPPEYRLSAVSSIQSQVAYIRGSEADPSAIAAFGVRNYMPGSSKQ